MPRSQASFTSLIVLSSEWRKIPGIDGMATLTLFPSATNIGSIKSVGDKVVSRTNERIDSFVLSLLFLLNILVGIFAKIGKLETSLI